jgi:hypothetical protein
MITEGNTAVTLRIRKVGIIAEMDGSLRVDAILLRDGD